MQIEDLTLKKNQDIQTIGPDATVASAVDLLNKHNIGALPVCDSSGTLIGILSERDIIHALSDAEADFSQVKVSDLMTSDVVTCGVEDDVNDIMEIMDNRSIRHMPVVADGRLATILSSRDILAALLNETKSQVTTMTLAYEMVR